MEKIISIFIIVYIGHNKPSRSGTQGRKRGNNMSKYWYMTDEERTENFKYLLIFGEIIRSYEIGEIRVKIISYNKKKYRLMIKNGKN